MLRRTVPFLIAAVLGLVPHAVQAQAAAPAEARKAAMQAVSFLAGHWEGTGWMRRGPGEPQKFQSVEDVEARLGGTILTIEGRHWDSDPNVFVHHAFAVLSANAAGDGYDFRSYLADGRDGTYRGALKDGAFVWEMSPAEGSQIRYTIRVADGKWHEVGEFSRDGKTWAQFFGMDLERKPAP